MGVSCIFCYYQIIFSCFMNACDQQGKNAAIVTCGEILQIILIWILAAVPNLRIYGYIIAQCIAPLAVCVCIAIFLYRKQMIRFCIRSLLLEPAVCAFLVYLWTRIFFTFYSGLCSQWAALIFTLLSSLVFFVLLLRLFGINLRKYLMNTASSNTFQPMFY